MDKLHPELPANKKALYVDPTAKPAVLAPDLDAIPAALRDAARWVLWRLEWKTEHKRWAKVPYRPSGARASSTTPQHWTTFEAVAVAYRTGGFDGVGFVLGDGFVGLDLDGVRDPDTGELTPEAAAILDQCATYTEVSPSGTGVKVFALGRWPADWHRALLPGGGGEIEGYGRARYFTVVGRPVREYPVADAQAAIDDLAARLVPVKPPKQRPAQPSTAVSVDRPDDDDAALLRRARRAKNGAKFARLWDGDTSEYDGDESRADLALSSLLAFYAGPDPGRIDRLFRRSGLMRAKWDDRRGEQTYGQMTIAAALAERTEFARPRGVRATIATGGQPTTGEEPEAAPSLVGDDRPEIRLGVDRHRVNAEAAAALAREPDLYQRGGMLVQVVAQAADEPDPAAGRSGRRPVGAPFVRALPRELLPERLTRCARWVREVTRGDGTVEQPAHPPGWCVSAVHARGSWPQVRHLEAIVPHPALLPDGSILATPGYDSASRLLVWLPPDLDVTVPDRPTRDDAHAAVAELQEVIADFPFARPEHQAAWFASLLTPLAWFAFDGPAPLFLIDGNVRGVGKGLLADVVALIVTGRRHHVMAYTSDRDELRKRITSLAAEGERMVLLDNLAGQVGNDVLDAALTSDTWKDRLLGANITHEGPLHVTWFATGNNVQLGADTSRRACHIRLESPEERPELRSGFRRADLRGYVRQHRGRLLSAALTILRAWHVAGRPRHGLASWGSFEGWSGVVREAIVFAGLPDPGETREELQTAADQDAAAMADILAGLREMDPERRGVTASEIVDRLRAMTSPPEWASAMRGAIEDLCGRLDARPLGYKFRHFAKRNFGGWFLDRRGEDRKAGNRWGVQRVGVGRPSSTHAAGDEGDAGDVPAVAEVRRGDRSTLFGGYDRPQMLPD